VDPECAEAQEILRNSRAQIAANPASADDTVDLTNETARKGDPDDTVSLARTPSAWERLTGAVRKWTQADAPATAEKSEVSDRERAKT
jgi:MoxR-like ATPase